MSMLYFQDVDLTKRMHIQIKCTQQNYRTYSYCSACFGHLETADGQQEPYMVQNFVLEGM
jgi:hypothetical protein